ncbi:uncharacterized protein TNCV_4247181 [Trichonephila clavipes]|nr:uncharacterized protein TNCV_4247181 [Trichonephila clavipes]
MTFLGYQVCSEGTHPLPDRIADLQNFTVPETARDLRRFLGMLRGAQLLTWTSELDTAFSKCKEALSEVTLLTHPAPDVPLGIFMDASAHHVGVALMQHVDDLEICTYAMLRDDFIRGTLQPPYSGPYRILQRIGNVFVLRIGTKEVRVSVDSIKPAYVLADDPSSFGPSLPTPGSSRPIVTTRSGRQVHFTDFFQA